MTESERGEPGQRGEPGPGGRQGEAGTTGRVGEAGQRGRTGLTGDTGVPGATGQRGLQGAQPKLRWSPMVGYLLLVVLIVALAVQAVITVQDTNDLERRVTRLEVDVGRLRK